MRGKATIAAPAAATLRNARAYRQAVRLGEQLQETLQRVDADEAFALLRRISQRSNRKLRDVARDLIERTASP